MKQGTRYVLTFLFGAIVGGTLAGYLVARRWKHDFVSAYVAGVAGEAYTAREIYRGHGVETADRILLALPSCIIGIEAEFPNVQGRDSTYWLVRDVYEAKGIPFPEQIKSVLTSLPPRAGCKPPVRKSVKRGDA